MGLHRRVIIDTDPGVDDAQAILFAFLCEEFRIDALTTVFGNVQVETATQNAIRLVEMVGRLDVPIYSGAAEPLVERNLHFARDVHGDNGFGNVELPPPRGQATAGYAAVELARRVVEAPGEFTILALGPLTNVALAMRLEPRVVTSVKEIIYMGGIVSGPGNVTPLATANVLNDCEAAKVVFDAGMPLTMVGQDVTRSVRVQPERRERIRRANRPISEFVYQITAFYADAYVKERIPGFPVHDLLVMAYALRPELFETRRLRVEIETHGRVTRGMTAADFRPYSAQAPNVTVCMKADANSILDWYESVITSR